MKTIKRKIPISEKKIPYTFWGNPEGESEPSSELE